MAQGGGCKRPLESSAGRGLCGPHVPSSWLLQEPSHGRTAGAGSWLCCLPTHLHGQLPLPLVGNLQRRCPALGRERGGGAGRAVGFSVFTGCGRWRLRAWPLRGLQLLPQQQVVPGLLHLHTRATGPPRRLPSASPRAPGRAHLSPGYMLLAGLSARGPTAALHRGPLTGALQSWPCAPASAPALSRRTAASEGRALGSAASALGRAQRMGMAFGWAVSIQHLCTRCQSSGVS